MYRLSDDSCRPVESLDSFRARIPAADRAVRIGGPILEVVERIGAEVDLTDSEVVHWAVTQLAADLGIERAGPA